MKRLDRLIAFAGIAVLIACSDQTAPTGETPTRQVERDGPAEPVALGDVYVNDRFGFSIAYPSGRFTRRAAPQNGDGQTFDGQAGSVLRVFGAHNALSASLAERVDQERGAFRSLTEDRETANGWIGFGYGKNGQWRAVHLVKTGGDFLTAEFTAPGDAAQPVRDLGRRIVATLEATAQS